MKLAALIIRRGAVAEVIGGRKYCTFGQASRQLARFQEEEEEVTHALLEAQTSQRKVCEHELRRNM